MLSQRILVGILSTLSREIGCAGVCEISTPPVKKTLGKISLQSAKMSLAASRN